jgi:kynureninase
LRTCEIYAENDRYWAIKGTCNFTQPAAALVPEQALDTAIQLFDHCPEVTNLGEHSLSFKQGQKKRFSHS